MHSVFRLQRDRIIRLEGKNHGLNYLHLVAGEAATNLRFSTLRRRAITVVVRKDVNGKHQHTRYCFFQSVSGYAMMGMASSAFRRGSASMSFRFGKHNGNDQQANQKKKCVKGDRHNESLEMRNRGETTSLSSALFVVPRTMVVISETTDIDNNEQHESLPH